jgi:hypothetical protein
VDRKNVDNVRRTNCIQERRLRNKSSEKKEREQKNEEGSFFRVPFSWGTLAV